VGGVFGGRREGLTTGTGHVARARIGAVQVTGRAISRRGRAATADGRGKHNAERRPGKEGVDRGSLQDSSLGDVLVLETEMLDDKIDTLE